jgi:parvulin-like peptidyl-prolyl isomerase
MAPHSFPEVSDMTPRQFPLAWALWLVCTGAAHAQTSPGKTETYPSPVSANIPAAADKPAALVNGEMISMAAVKAVLEVRPYPTTLKVEEIKAIRQETLDMLVQDVLVRQFLSKYAPPVAPADVTKEMQNLHEQLKKDAKTLTEFLGATGQTLDQLQKDLAARLQWRNYLQKRLPEEQAKKYYEENKPYFDNVRVRASHLLVRIPPGATAEQKKSLQNRAETLCQEIGSGKISFEAAVKQYSDCPSKDKGGDLGPFPYKFVVLEPIAKAAFSLKIGEMSGVVTTDLGYHILKVTDRTQPKEASSYEKVRDSVRDIWAQDVELMDQIISHQRKNSKIETFLP